VIKSSALKYSLSFLLKNQRILTSHFKWTIKTNLLWFYGILLLFSCTKEPEPQPAPVVCVEQNFNAVHVGIPFQFVSCSQNAVSHHWSFGAVVTREQNPTIIFHESGYVIGTLTITGLSGQTESISFRFMVDGQVGTVVPLSSCSENIDSFFGVDKRNDDIFLYTTLDWQGNAGGGLRIFKLKEATGQHPYDKVWQMDITDDGIPWQYPGFHLKSDGSIMAYRNARVSEKYMAQFAEIDTEGNLIASHIFNSPEGSRAIFAATDRDAVTVCAGTYNDHDLWIFKFSEPDHIDEEFIYAMEGYKLAGRRIFSLPDGYVVTVNMESLTEKPNTFLVVKLDNELKLKWMKSYEGVTDYYGVTDADVDEAGNIAMLVAHGWPVPFALVILNPDGNATHDQLLLSNTKNDATTTMRYFDDALLFVCDDEVSQISLSGDLIWRRNFKSGFHNVVIDGDQRATLVGYSLQFIDGCIDQILNPIFCTIQSNGQIIE
jgi:hypothetical protein